MYDEPGVCGDPAPLGNFSACRAASDYHSGGLSPQLTGYRLPYARSYTDLIERLDSERFHSVISNHPLKLIKALMDLG